MAVLNELDRFHLVINVINRVPQLGDRAAHVKQELQFKLIEHSEYTHAHGEDMPEVRDWKWSGRSSGRAGE
jgi:xylulose-5-phosphate/fructose-6-phosphate phosphoketolase